MATQTASSTTMETLAASATEFCQLGSKKVVEECVPMTAQLDPPGFSPQFFEPPAEKGDPPPQVLQSQEGGDSSSLVTVSIESASSTLEPPPPQPAAAPQAAPQTTSTQHPPDWEWLQQHLKKKESQTTTTTASATPVTPAAQREEPPPVTPSRAKNFSLKDPSPRRRSLRLQRLRGRSSSTTTSGSVASSTTTPKRDHLHNNTNHTTNTMMMMIQRRPAEVSPDKAPAEPVTVVPSPARRAQVQVKNHENNNDDDASTVVSAVPLNPLPPVSSPAAVSIQAVPVVSSATSQTTTRSPRPPINLITQQQQQQQQQQQLSEPKPQEPTTSTFSNNSDRIITPPLIKAQAMCSAMANPMAKCVDSSCQYCHSIDWNKVVTTCPRPPPLQLAAAKQRHPNNNSQFPCGMAIVMQDEEDTYYDDDDDGYFYGETSTVDSTTVSSSSLETPYHHKPRHQRRQQPYHHPGTDSSSGSTALTQHDEIMTPQRRQPIVTTHRILSTPPSSLPRTDVAAVRLHTNVTKQASKALLAAASPVLDDAMEWNARDRVWVLDYSTHPASDWELIQLYLQPRSLGSLPLSFKTIPTLLPWCRHLKLTGLLQDVDQFSFSWIIHCTSAEMNQGEVPLPLNSLLALTKIAYACGWTLTMAQTRQWLKHKLLHPNNKKKSSPTDSDNHDDNDNELEWSLTELLQLLLLLSEYEGLREYLWECVEAYLPPDLETSLEKHSHALSTNHLTVYLLRDGMMQATMAERASALVQQWKETSISGNKQQEVEHFHSILSVDEDGDDNDNDDDTLTVFTTASSQPGSLRIKIPRDQEGSWNVAKLHEWFQDIIVAMGSFEQRQQKLAHQQKTSSSAGISSQQQPHQDRAPILRQSADARKNKQRFEC